MKRLVALMLCVIVTLVFVSCGDTVSGHSSTTQSESITSAVSSDDSSNSSTSSDCVSSVDERYVDMVAREKTILKNMNFGKVFYRAAQATDIYLIDIANEDVDTVATLRSLQGLVARHFGGAIYLDDGSNASKFWIEYCSSEYGLYFEKSTPAQVIKRFSKYIKGAVLYSPDIPYEFTVAQNTAIQSDYLVATGLSVSLVNPALTNKPLIDIRGQFKNKKDAYKYIIENCLKTSSTQYIGILNQNAAFSDYVYSVKSLVLDFDFSESWESEMLSYIIGRPDWNETAYVFTDRAISNALLNVLSADGFATINTGWFANCTLFSSVTASYNGRTIKHDIKSLDENKIYVSMFLNVESMSDIQQTAYNVWNHKTGASRISVEFYPIMYELAPPIAKWYRQNLTANDMLISADLGCGMANLSLMKPETAQLFRNNNQYFLNACGISVISNGMNLHTVDDFNAQLDGMDVVNTENTITASMRFTDLESFETWLNSATPVANAPMYFLIELPSSNFEVDGLNELGTVISTATGKRKGVFEFVLTENLLSYM